LTLTSSVANSDILTSDVLREISQVWCFSEKSLCWLGFCFCFPDFLLSSWKEVTVHSYFIFFFFNLSLSCVFGYRSTKRKSEKAPFTTLWWTFYVTHDRLLHLQ